MTSVTDHTAEPAAEHTIDIHTTAGKLAELHKRTQESLHPVGEAAVEKVHAKGKLTARERIYALLDDDSFVELDALAKHRSTNFGLGENRPVGDGVVTGYGTIDGRDVCIFSQDATVFGGSLGEVYGEKIVKVQELAVKTGRPLIGINDGAGARIQEGVVSLGLYSRIFRNNILASGVVPQISLIMGAAAGGHVYSPALTDFVVMVDQTSQMFITGPDVIKTVTGEDVTMEELGGAHTHMAKSGTAHYVASGEQDAFEYVRELLSYLPPNNFTDPPRLAVPHPAGPIEDNLTAEDIELDTLIPDSPNQPYDMHEVITRILDDDEFLEIQNGYATNIIVGFGRIDGRPVGIVANQPTQFAGCLDINASEKAARFVRTCDCFNIPIIMLVDVPGFLPGTEQEYNGIIRRGAKLLFAYGEATVPKITVITRKAYGGAYCVMNSKNIRCDYAIAFPSAEIAVMGPEGAVNIIHRTELAKATDPEKTRKALLEDYREKFANPYNAAELGYVDEIIDPAHTRPTLIRALDMCKNKRAVNLPRKHGNLPL